MAADRAGLTCLDLYLTNSRGSGIIFNTGGDILDYEKIRKELGLTQTDVAKAVGVSLQTYRWWFLGVMKPKPENEKKLREVLKITE